MSGAIFIGERMADPDVRVEYKDLPIRSKTRKGKLRPFKPRMRRGFRTKQGGAAMHRAAEQLAKAIARLLRSRSRGLITHSTTCLAAGTKVCDIDV